MAVKYVPFSEVREYLDSNGYQLMRRRTDPNDPNVGFAIFGQPGWPNIGFPVRARKVADEHFQEIKKLVQRWSEEDADPELDQDSE